VSPQTEAQSCEPSDTPQPARGRRALLAFPRYTPSFGTFEYAYSILGVKAFMPPQGLLVIAAALPPSWDVRFVDENIRAVSDADFEWADVVFVSGMHIQRTQMHDLCARAHAHGKVTALGGPSVSACPEYYPDFDYLHVGEMGDATDELVARLERDISRPPAQVQLTTNERLDLSAFPLPAYELCKLNQYFMGSIQFSSGCPYDCEFCDIPALYGRNPRLKTPAQVTAELDKMRACGLGDAVYFVDDNFIGNRRAARELVDALIEWQKRNAYPLTFACEATLNIAKRPEMLEAMREAKFETVFCGIETPDPEALKFMDKAHNMMVPIFEAIETLNAYGMEVVSGIIMGLDTDTRDTGEALLAFIDRAQIPVLTINLLQALPRTKLWTRLAGENRLVTDDDRESNVVFLLPYQQVIEMWRDCMARAYDPETLFRRFVHQIDATYAKRLNPPRQVNFAMVRRGMGILARLLIAAGIRSHYRRAFWRFAWPLLKKGDIERVIAVGLVAHHLIMFTREAVSGRQNASFYSRKLRKTSAEALTAAAG
jgi:radical SAM superfamily enzyme YgiQ (UPF0313 family)